MIAQIGSGNSGWSEYTLFKNGATLRPGATLIAGDTALGDAICKTTHYKSGQYVRMVLSFSNLDTHITPEKGREIAKEFVSLFMHGYRDDEYHVDIVEHTDTDNLHYHIRIPKLNLLTGTQLKIYYDKADRHRKQLIVDYLDDKYNLTRAADRRRKPHEKAKAQEESIQKWREEHGQKPFDFSKKKGRDEAQESVYNYIEELEAAGLVTSQNEVIVAIKELGLEIVKVDHDRKKDFDYITVRNETGKIRLKGEIYGEGYWKRDKGQNRGDEGRDRGRDRELQKELDKELEKRKQWIDKRYRRARERTLAARREDTRPGAEEEQVESVRPDLRPGLGVGRGERSDDNLLEDTQEQCGVEQGVGARVRPTERMVHQDKEAVNDSIGAEAFERIRAARSAREEVIRKIHTELAANTERIRERIEADRSSLRAEVERDSRKAREDRVGRAFGSRIEKAREGNSRQTIHKFVQHYRKGIEQLAEAVQGAISSTKYAIRSLGRTLTNVKNAIKPNKKEKQIDEVEKAIEQHFREGNPNTPRRGGMRM
jgi:hypothetical protein